jgi:hypothetical protein
MPQNQSHKRKAAISQEASDEDIDQLTKTSDGLDLITKAIEVTNKVACYPIIKSTSLKLGVLE